MGKEDGTEVQSGIAAVGPLSLMDKYPHNWLLPRTLSQGSFWEGLPPCGVTSPASPGPVTIASCEDGPPEMWFQLIFREMDSLAGQVLPWRMESTGPMKALPELSPQASSSPKL